MKKNILVLTGSPRARGNSDLLADAFIRGAAEAGHEVVKCDLARKNIRGCTACDRCFSSGKPCVFDDDFNEIAPLIQRADIIVFVTPLYWYTFPAQLKAAIDKLYSFEVGKKKLDISGAILIACGGDPEEFYFDGIISSYRLILRHLHWEDMGRLIVPGVNNKGDVLSTDYLSRAEKMGRDIT